MTNVILVSSIIFIIIILFYLRQKQNENFFNEHINHDGVNITGVSNEKTCADYNDKCIEKTSIPELKCPDLKGYVKKTSINEEERCPACICPKLSGRIDCNNSELKEQIKKLKSDLKTEKKKPCIIDEERCREYAKQNPGKVCSSGKTPCITIERPINVNKGKCPPPAPCVQKPAKVIKIKEPCDKDCGKKYKIVGVKTVESKRKILELVQKMLDDPSNENLSKLKQIKTLLDGHNLMSHDNLEAENEELKNKLKNSRKRELDELDELRKLKNSRKQELDELDELRKLKNKKNKGKKIGKIAELEDKLKKLESNLNKTPSPTELAQILDNNNNDDNNDDNDDNDRYPKGIWNDKASSEYSKCLV